jgi:hypothetical protein
MLAFVALAGCAGPSERTLAPPAMPPWAVADARVIAAHPGLECVPFARRESEIALFGDAWTWWDEARGLYARGATCWCSSAITARRAISRWCGAC